MDNIIYFLSTFKILRQKLTHFSSRQYLTQINKVNKNNKYEILIVVVVSMKRD